MFRSRSEDAPTTSFRDVIPVLPRFESEEGELKAILSSGLAMTASTIATMTRKEGDDLVGEAHRDCLVVPFNRDLSTSAGSALTGGRDESGSVAQGTQVARLVYFNNALGIAGVGCLPCQVLPGCHQDELVAGLGTGQDDRVVAAPPDFLRGYSSAQSETKGK